MVSSEPEVTEQKTRKGRFGFTKKSWVLIAVAGFLIVVLVFVPLVQVSSQKVGKIFFSSNTKTNNLQNVFEYHYFEVVPNNSSEIKTTVNDAIYNYSGPIDTEDVDYIIFESDDWNFKIYYDGSSISQTLSTVEYLFEDQTTIERKESQISSFFVGLFIVYIDKSTDIKNTGSTILISERVSGDFIFSKYLERAEEQRIPLNIKYSFDKIEIVNKDTFATDSTYTYDPENDYFVQDLVIKITYEITYSITKISYTSIILSEISTLKAALLGSIIAAMVGALASGFKKRLG